jgi:hypothetical protein
MIDRNSDPSRRPPSESESRISLAGPGPGSGPRFAGARAPPRRAGAAAGPRPGPNLKILNQRLHPMIGPQLASEPAVTQSLRLDIMVMA